MTIDFYIRCETESFSWINARNVPRVGDYVRENERYDGRKLLVTEIIWVDPDLIQIITDPI